jgi:hypothetical protein
MKSVLLGVALAAFTAVPLTSLLPAQADDSFSSVTSDAPNTALAGFVVEGTIRHINSDGSGFAFYGDNSHRYNIHDDSAAIRLGAQAADVSVLHPGMHVRVVGHLHGIGSVEATQVRVLLPHGQTFSALLTPIDESASAATVPDSPADDGAPVTVDAVVSSLNSDGRHLVLRDSQGHTFQVDTLGTDILLPDADQDGHFADLASGLTVHVIGTQLPDGSIQADRIRVTASAAPSAANTALLTPAASAHPIPAAAPADLSTYTGILIDARDLPRIERSMAPNIVDAAGSLLYPDRSHVPTPDEVQDESIVRYYHTLDAAEQGVAGAHPLILNAVAVVGPGQDSVQLSTGDAALLTQLDKRLRFSRTWKVGFLIPMNQ